MSVCTVFFVAVRACREAVLCLHSILRRGRSCREAGAVFAQYSSSQSGRVAKRVLCLHSILRRSPGVSRSGCCVCTVSFDAARGRVAKRVLCSHSIFRSTKTLVGDVRAKRSRGALEDSPRELRAAMRLSAPAYPNTSRRISKSKVPRSRPSGNRARGSRVVRPMPSGRGRPGSPCIRRCFRSRCTCIDRLSRSR